MAPGLPRLRETSFSRTWPGIGLPWFWSRCRLNRMGYVIVLCLALEGLAMSVFGLALAFRGYSSCCSCSPGVQDMTASPVSGSTWMSVQLFMSSASSGASCTSSSSMRAISHRYSTSVLKAWERSVPALYSFRGPGCRGVPRFRFAWSLLVLPLCLPVVRVCGALAGVRARLRRSLGPRQGATPA